MPALIEKMGITSSPRAESPADTVEKAGAAEFDVVAVGAVDVVFPKPGTFVILDVS